jgi:hypothetical protein
MRCLPIFKKETELDEATIESRVFDDVMPTLEFFVVFTFSEMLPPMLVGLLDQVLRQKASIYACVSEGLLLLLSAYGIIPFFTCFPSVMILCDVGKMGKLTDVAAAASAGPVWSMLN